MFSLGNPILLRSVWASQPMVYPLCSQKKLNWLEVNSPPLSVWICLIEVEKKISTMVLNLTKVANTSDFQYKGYNQEYLE
jgi:hypothetical protein